MSVPEDPSPVPDQLRQLRLRKDPRFPMSRPESAGIDRSCCVPSHGTTIAIKHTTWPESIGAVRGPLLPRGQSSWAGAVARQPPASPSSRRRPRPRPTSRANGRGSPPPCDHLKRPTISYESAMVLLVFVFVSVLVVLILLFLVFLLVLVGYQVDNDNTNKNKNHPAKKKKKKKKNTFLTAGCRDHRFSFRQPPPPPASLLLLRPAPAQNAGD